MFGDSEVSAQLFEKNDAQDYGVSAIVSLRVRITMIAAWAGTRVVFLGGYEAPIGAGVVIEQRLEKYLKQFAVRCDGGAIRYATGAELALEGDPAHLPLKARSMFL